MRIGLFGYGKMGKMIEALAANRKHEIVATIDTDAKEIDYSIIDVAIDFSTPDAAFANIKGCLENNTPVVSGTTGWLDKYDETIRICNEKAGAFIYASNFSLGVNLFFELNSYLAQMMAKLEAYKLSIEEIHHTQKLDAPSGTAITLAEGIIEKTTHTAWHLEGEQKQQNSIPIHSVREGKVPGTHIIAYKSDVDTLQIEHKAHGREGFALGAIIAAEWLVGKTGVFNMKDVLNIS